MLRFLTATTILALLVQTIAWGAPISAATGKQMRLPKGEVATFYGNGEATVTDKRGKIIRRAFVGSGLVAGPAAGVVASQADMLRRLLNAPQNSLPYKPNALVVVFDSAAAPSSDIVELRPDQLHSLHESVARHKSVSLAIPGYSKSYAINRSFARLGVDSVERIARHFDRFRLSALRTAATAREAAPALDIADAYRIHLTNSSVQNAVRLLSDVPGIAYVSPDYYVTTTHAPPAVVTPAAMAAARERVAQIAAQRPVRSSQEGSIAHQIPTNYAVSSSAQSMLNAPGVDAVKAYDEIGMTFNQLPGAGELIANVSLGDVDDNIDTSDPCYPYAHDFGPTTHLINGQHYIDWQSMPLIPAYVVDGSGNASGNASACGIDEALIEVGLDFSVMAPLPHQLQRQGETGAAYSDLLGIAPGAKYELFVPQAVGEFPTQSDLLETFLAAALSTPHPDVITASIGLTAFAGFPQRYLEDDPLMESTIATLVNGLSVVVCLSANDGTEVTYPAAIGASGGSAATNVIAESGTPTNENDLAATTIPSQDHDSGAIDAGGTTLDDIFASPQNSQLTFPETRWTGGINFSSGFGTRVDLSAPSDNIWALSHTFDGAQAYPYDAVTPAIIGGTSASAPEIAASAAVVLQVARLTGHSLSGPAAVREFLHSTARYVANVPQADQDVHVGPQVDVGEAVDTLLKRAGRLPNIAVPRVAVAQRREEGDYNGAFFTDTATGAIDLAGPIDSGLDELAPITIAPDWEGLPAGTRFRLTVVGKPNDVLATTPWARLTPNQILHAVGSSSTSTTSHTVELEYSARTSVRSVAAYVNLTFEPGAPTRIAAPAPVVAPVTSGSTMNVSYDLTGVRSVSSPQLVISEPGRMTPMSANAIGLPNLFHASYTVPLTKLSGTVQVPVSRLQGAGVYGVTVEYGTSLGSESEYEYSNFAFTRVAAGSSVKAEPVSVSADGSGFVHTLYLYYNQSYQVRWDVSNVPGADGALLEIGAPGPSVFGSYNTFNNPNGSIEDDNGIDAGSYYTRQLSGKSGTIRLNGPGTLTPALFNQVRVIPLQGSKPAGEASDPSMLGMNGFTPPDGNPLGNFKFGNGGTGVVQTFALGDAANNVYSINSQTGNFQATPVLIGGNGVYYGLEGTIFSGDLQVVSAWDYTADFVDPHSGGIASFPPQYGILNLNLGLAPGAPEWGADFGFNNWFGVPSPGKENEDLAYNRQGNLGLFEIEPICSGNNCTPTIYLSTDSLPEPQSPSFVPTANPIGLSFGTPYNVTAAYTETVGGTTTVQSGGIEVDPALNEGIIEVGPPIVTSIVGSGGSNSPCLTAGGSTVSTVALTSGTITSFPGGGHGPILTTTYDPGTHTLAALDECGNLILTNVTTQQTTVQPLNYGGEPPYDENVYLAADATNHLLIVGLGVDPSFQTNNNAQSIVQEYSETGTFIKNMRGFSFDSVGEPGYLEIDETNRRLFLPELTGTMIEPAAY